MGNNAKDFQKLHGALIQSNKELKEHLTGLENRLSEAISQFAEKVSRLEQENNSLRGRLEGLERKVRRNNIVIFGIPVVEYTGKNLISFVAEKLSTLLDIEVTSLELDDAYVLGKGVNTDRRPILVELASQRSKQKIFGKVSKLKGTRVRISHDLAPEDREKAALLRKHLKSAKDRGLKAFIRGNRLHVGNEVYAADQLSSILPLADSEESDPEVSIRKSHSAPSTPTNSKNLDASDGVFEGEGVTERDGGTAVILPQIRSLRSGSGSGLASLDKKGTSRALGREKLVGQEGKQQTTG